MSHAEDQELAKSKFEHSREDSMPANGRCIL